MIESQWIYNSGNTSFNAALKTSFSLFDQSVLDDETICTRVVFLSDGESSYDKKYITTAQTNDIIIHGIGLGGSSDDEALADMSVSTGGVFQKADKSEMLSELYEKIYIYDQFDKTDTDGDGLYDIVETAGIRLCNGQIIYTDPNLPDSDGDKLDDGVEIDPNVKEGILIIYNTDPDAEPITGFYFIKYSDPWSEDSDDDGLLDSEDNAPMRKGIYVEGSEDVVTGELTIVASEYGFVGHSFIMYRSYINDTLDFTGLSGGYILKDDNTDYYKVEPCMYDITIGEYVAIGNTSVEADDFIPQPIEGSDKDDAGIMFNRELVTEVKNMDDGEQYYKKNLAYTRTITGEQWNNLIRYHNKNNHYSLIYNNCAQVASSAWDYIYSDGCRFDGETQNTPKGMKQTISTWEGCYEIDLRELLGL